MAIKCLVQEQLRLQYEVISDTSLVNFLTKEDLRLNIYLALIDQTIWSEAKKVDIVTAIILLQQSLDLHQLVSNVPDANNTEIILHGDRFSAQYYLLLSNYGENELIRSLALATRTINQLLIKYSEQKQANLNIDDNLRLEIDTTIMVHLLRYFNLAQLEIYLAVESPILQIETELVDLANLINDFFKHRMIV